MKSQIHELTNFNDKAVSKNTDLITRRIMAAGISICGILLCASTFIFALGNINTSHASPTTVSLGGEIMMTTYIAKDGYDTILVWNTTTGQSVSWYYDKEAKKYLKSPAGYQLPINPMN